MDPTVSVVMGTYNGARFVREQLDSILAQTLPPLEVIVADDGSSDGTLDIVRQVAEQAAVPVVVIVNPQQLGFADNFLAASRSARGDFIAFSDQDDRWEPQKLELSVAALQRHDAVYCAHAVRLMDEQGRDLGSTAQNVPRDLVVEPRTADPWGARYGFTVTVRRELLDLLPTDTRGVDTFSPQKPLSHDRWAYVLAWSTGRAVHLQAALASYRQHPHQLYGGPRGPVYRSKIHRVVVEEEDRFALLARTAGDRASAFRQLSTPAAAAAGDAWDRLGRLYALRRRTYAERPIRRRLAAFRVAFAEGAYAKGSSLGAGSKGAVMDAVFGIAGPASRSRIAALTAERSSRTPRLRTTGRSAGR